VFWNRFHKKEWWEQNVVNSCRLVGRERGKGAARGGKAKWKGKKEEAPLGGCENCTLKTQRANKGKRWGERGGAGGSPAQIKKKKRRRPNQNIAT